MERRHQIRLLLAISVVLIAAAVWFGAGAQRSASNRGADAVHAARSMLIARLDIETGLRGFLLSGRRQFLRPYWEGIRAYRGASRRASRINALGASGERLLQLQDSATRRWLSEASSAISGRRAGSRAPVLLLERSKRGMDRFRRLNARMIAASEAERKRLEDRATRLLLAIIAALVGIAAAAGYLLIERPSRRSARQRAEQAEFADTLQFAADEGEAQNLLARELERAIPGGRAYVFSRNNSENRLETATAVDDGTELAERMSRAAPGDCLAVRRGRPFERRSGAGGLIECELCGATASDSLCLPSLVGGEVVGSVLVGREGEPLRAREKERFQTTVSAAAPVLANLRNLEIAEARAVTDSLTGLANSRAAGQDLERMAAFAGRTGTPLTAIMLDLDHFKRINDTFGHQVGDEALAALGRVLRAGTRTSDFVARYGGEEFLVLLQDTNAGGGAEVAETLREAVRQMHVPGLTTRVTASFGVASIPEHAGEADALLRCADRALYAAKEGGRDQVRVFGDAEARPALRRMAADG